MDGYQPLLAKVIASIDVIMWAAVGDQIVLRLRRFEMDIYFFINFGGWLAEILSRLAVCVIALAACVATHRLGK